MSQEEGYDESVPRTVVIVAAAKDKRDAVVYGDRLSNLLHREVVLHFVNEQLPGDIQRSLHSSLSKITTRFLMVLLVVYEPRESPGRNGDFFSPEGSHPAILKCCRTFKPDYGDLKVLLIARNCDQMATILVHEEVEKQLGSNQKQLLWVALTEEHIIAHIRDYRFTVIPAKQTSLNGRQMLVLGTMFAVFLSLVAPPPETLLVSGGDSVVESCSNQTRAVETVLSTVTPPHISKHF